MCVAEPDLAIDWLSRSEIYRLTGVIIGYRHFHLHRCFIVHSFISLRGANKKSHLKMHVYYFIPSLVTIEIMIQVTFEPQESYSLLWCENYVMSRLIQAESHQSRNLKIQALTDISINSCNPALKCYETACFSSENTKLWHEVNWWKGPAGMTGCQEEQIIIPFEKDVLKTWETVVWRVHCRRYHAAGGSLWVTGKEGVSNFSPVSILWQVFR